MWGLAATAGTLASGGLTDRFGGRRVINTAIVLAATDFALLPWTSAHLPSTVVALLVWGVCGWGLLAPQTHRLIAALPTAAPLLTGLASATVYVGVSAAPLVGQAGMAYFGAHWLGAVGAAFIALALVTAEAAHAVIHRTPPAKAVPSATAARSARRPVPSKD